MNKKIENLLNMVNGEILMDMVDEVNSWDDSLDYLEYIDMDLFDDYLEVTPTVLANMIHYGDFDPNDRYFKFNGYGNLESYSIWEVKKELEDCKEEIIERFIELYEENHVNIYFEEVKAILDSEEEE